MEHIDIQQIKDAIAKKYGFSGWLNFLSEAFVPAHSKNILTVMDEIILEVSKQTAEKQREICAEKAQLIDIFTRTDINKESILNAPAPQIK